MDSNTHSPQPSDRDWLAALVVVTDGLTAQNLDRLSEVVRSERVPVLRGLVDRLEGQWLKELAGVDARGAAGAELGQEVGSTAAWLRNRLRLSASAATRAVRTARALFRGPLTTTGQAVCDGELSVVMLRSWPTAPTTCPTTSPPRPNQSWSRQPANWTQHSSGGPLATCSRSPTLMAPTTTGSAAMPAAGCG